MGRKKTVEQIIRAEAGCSGKPWPIELDSVNPLREPELVGQSYHFTTITGKPVYYPNAYRRAYGKPVYHSSTLRIEVGRLYAQYAAAKRCLASLCGLSVDTPDSILTDCVLERFGMA